jgi:NADH dehydrogenase
LTSSPLHAVTGAFGYSGRHIALRLLDRGHRVRTLTSASGRGDPLADRVEVCRFRFDDAAALAESLAGVEVLYNTYWIRFNHGSFTRAQGVTNSLALFDAAKAAGVRRVVHVSITKPSADSPFEYFSSKARLEAALKDTGLSHAILRPAVLFGAGDILVNNIAWVLRRFPVFGLFGDGDYGIRPIHVEDFADLAVEHGAGRDDVTLDAVGPERFTYRELVVTLARIMGTRGLVVPMPPGLGHAIGRLVGRLVGDVILTRDEIGGLMAGLLDVDTPATGPTRLTEWATTRADALGRRYASELARRSGK